MELKMCHRTPGQSLMELKMCHSTTRKEIVTRRVIITGKKIVMRKVATAGRQCNSIGLPCICSGLLEEAEVQRQRSDPQPHVASMQRY